MPGDTVNTTAVLAPSSDFSLGERGAAIAAHAEALGCYARTSKMKWRINDGKRKCGKAAALKRRESLRKNSHGRRKGGEKKCSGRRRREASGRPRRTFLLVEIVVEVLLALNS